MSSRLTVVCLPLPSLSRTAETACRLCPTSTFTKLDFPAFLNALRRIGYDGWLSVEVFQRPDQDTALEKSIAYLKPLLREDV